MLNQIWNLIFLSRDWFHLTEPELIKIRFTLIERNQNLGLVRYSAKFLEFLRTLLSTQMLSGLRRLITPSNKISFLQKDLFSNLKSGMRRSEITCSGIIWSTLAEWRKSRYFNWNLFLKKGCWTKENTKSHPGGHILKVSGKYLNFWLIYNYLF